jgi:hypothetical protein
MIRSTGVGTVPTSGSAADMFYNPGAGRGTFHAYNYGSSAYLPLGIQGNPLCLNDQIPGGAFVGIGTSSPTTNLTVAGDITVYRPGTPTTGAIFFNSAGGVYIWYNGSQWVFSPNVSNLSTALGAWTAYTPTATDGVGTNVPLSNAGGSYCVSGTVLFFEFYFTCTGPSNLVLLVQLPVTLLSVANNGQTFSCYVTGGSGTQNLCTQAYADQYHAGIQLTGASGLAITVRLGGTLRIS